jgi:hypothetical protein
MYAVKSSDGRTWGNYKTKREANEKARDLRAHRGGFRGTFRVIRASSNSPKVKPKAIYRYYVYNTSEGVDYSQGPFKSRYEAAAWKRSQGGGRWKIIKRRINPAVAKVKMRRAPKNWIKAKAVRVVTRGGKRIVEVKR